MENEYEQGENGRKYCWRCKVCGWKSPLTAQTCENPACGANLSIYGEPVFTDLTPQDEDEDQKIHEKKEGEEIEGICISIPTEALIFAGDTYTLHVMSFTSSEWSEIPSEKLNFQSSDTSVATVDSSGKVTLISEGLADITVSMTYGEKTLSDTLHCHPLMPPKVYLSPSEISLKPGENKVLKASTKPDDYGVYFKSSNKLIATVDEQGSVTAVTEGTARIQATIHSGPRIFSAFCNVTVSKSMPDGKKVHQKDNKWERNIASQQEYEMKKALQKEQEAEAALKADVEIWQRKMKKRDKIFSWIYWITAGIIPLWNMSLWNMSQSAIEDGLLLFMLYAVPYLLWMIFVKAAFSCVEKAQKKGERKRIRRGSIIWGIGFALIIMWYLFWTIFWFIYIYEEILN